MSKEAKKKGEAVRPFRTADWWRCTICRFTTGFVPHDIITLFARPENDLIGMDVSFDCFNVHASSMQEAYKQDHLIVPHRVWGQPRMHGCVSRRALF